MGDLIQIGPDVLLATEVLSPDRGREYRQEKVAARRDRPPHAEPREGDRGNGQMAII